MIGLFLANIFLSWRNSKTSADPDWSYFNLWGFTGAVYGRDFADCKTPAIHLWYLFLSKIAGRDVKRVKFAHHFILGLSGMMLYHLTGNFWNSLLFIVMLNSGWLLAFHGNVTQHPAVFIALALALNSTISPLLWILALLFEPKLLPVFAVLYWKYALLLMPLGILFYLFRSYYPGIWESVFEIPKRIGISRKGMYEWMPWYTSTAFLYLLPPLFLSCPDWIPILVYMMVIALGRVVRQNHLLPLIAWVSLPPPLAIFFILLDAITHGFYFGNQWERFYASLEEPNQEAEQAGRFLKDKDGTLFVNGIHSGVYLHSGKPPMYGYTEQIEIRDNTPERKTRFVEKWKEHPADWVVTGLGAFIKFQPMGYQMAYQSGNTLIYKRKR